MDILMPQLGETVTEGKITAWFKSIGDAVKPGDNLFEIETDKVSMEVPATAAGRLAEIRVAAGEVAPVGAVVAVVAEDRGRTTEDRGRIAEDAARTAEAGGRKIEGDAWRMKDGSAIAAQSVVSPPSEPAPAKAPMKV